MTSTDSKIYSRKTPLLAYWVDQRNKRRKYRTDSTEIQLSKSVGITQARPAFSRHSTSAQYSMGSYLWGPPTVTHPDSFDNTPGVESDPWPNHFVVNDYPGKPLLAVLPIEFEPRLPPYGLIPVATESNPLPCRRSWALCIACMTNNQMSYNWLKNLNTPHPHSRLCSKWVFRMSRNPA